MDRKTIILIAVVFFIIVITSVASIRAWGVYGHHGYDQRLIGSAAYYEDDQENDVRGGGRGGGRGFRGHFGK